MIGDLFLCLKIFIKQQFFCIHKYKIVNRKDYQGGSFYVCVKCEKIKE
jgi:hypothetical protein